MNVPQAAPTAPQPKTAMLCPAWAQNVSIYRVTACITCPPLPSGEKEEANLRNLLISWIMTLHCLLTISIRVPWEGLEIHSRVLISRVNQSRSPFVRHQADLPPEGAKKALNSSKPQQTGQMLMTSQDWNVSIYYDITTLTLLYWDACISYDIILLRCLHILWRYNTDHEMSAFPTTS